MIFKRWTIRFKHDKSPIDAGAYVHKAAAIKALDAMANKDKLEVTQIAMMSLELAEHLTGTLSEL
jgi:hypothetical protein